MIKLHIFCLALGSYASLVFEIYACLLRYLILEIK